MMRGMRPEEEMLDWVSRSLAEAVWVLTQVQQRSGVDDLGDEIEKGLFGGGLLVGR
jgi:hypothetical protein